MNTETASLAEIFDDGYTAHFEGFGLESNPYPHDDDRHLTWNDGFEKSEDDLDGTQ